MVCVPRLLAAAYLTFLALADAPAPKASRYFPLAVGNSWTYSYREAAGKAPRTLVWSVTRKQNGNFALWQKPKDGDKPLEVSVVDDGVVEAGTTRYLLQDPIGLKSHWSNNQDEFEVTSVSENCSVSRHSFRKCVVIHEVDKGSGFDSITTYVADLGPVQYVYQSGAVMTIISWHTGGSGKARRRR